MTRHKIETTIMISTGSSSEYEAKIQVCFTHTDGCPQSYDDPGSPDEIEIDTINVISGPDTTSSTYWLVDLIGQDSELLAECELAVMEYQTEAEDRRADERRDRIMMEKFNG